MWSSLSSVLPHYGPNYNLLREKLDELSVSVTKLLRLASTTALLDLLQHHEQGQPLPTPDQDYFQFLFSAINPEGHTPKAGSETARLYDLLHTVPGFASLLPTIQLAGASTVLNTLAKQMATVTRNSVVFRLWDIQRDRLSNAIRSLIHEKQFTLDGKQLNEVLNDLQLFLRVKANHRQDGQYGFEAPYAGINTVLQQEFARLPFADLNFPAHDKAGRITRKVLTTNWHLFLPYFIERLGDRGQQDRPRGGDEEGGA